MGKILKREITHIQTADGQNIVRRVTTVQCPNGKLRFPTDYYDATPGIIKVSETEIENLRIDAYQNVI